MKYIFFSFLLLVFTDVVTAQQTKPNIIIINADDLGYGDISANGATKIHTPNIDKIAKQGLRFTNGYATSSTCTPSRFSLLTGKYAWRKSGTGIAPGDAALIIPTNALTLPKMLQRAGYRTAAVGKWHLGLGPQGGPDWNEKIAPGPLEVGFDYCFIMPATGDRVPCVYLENHLIVDLDAADPIKVNYQNKIGNDPTGLENPEQLKVRPSHGHNNTIVNGVSRIGWMSGGNKARWVDEDMADRFTGKALHFIEDNKQKPFFLYFAAHDIHVPRVPHSRFVGKSGMGVRGDAILQLDWCVGEILNKLNELQLTNNTLIVFTSDNGPVVDDGYIDEAVEKLNGHTPSGNMRGGKFGIYEAGTKVPLLVSWPGKIPTGKASAAAISQVDLFASFAALAGEQLAKDDAPDSFNMLNVLLGKNTIGREYIIEQGMGNNLAIVKNYWKYIEPHQGAKRGNYTNVETGNDAAPQLYNLMNDAGEQNNLAAKYPAKVKELAALLKQVKTAQVTRKN